jgi:hypothetical protein
VLRSSFSPICPVSPSSPFVFPEGYDGGDGTCCHHLSRSRGQTCGLAAILRDTAVMVGRLEKPSEVTGPEQWTHRKLSPPGVLAKTLSVDSATGSGPRGGCCLDI